eukprot:TRINITY_DN1979_c0_g1_i1.p1 TRINITY_DN1979_c0_g1~~TRINITY_DN1979_c0_g1_i1.p1  ORF type:complete len:1038 (+),score=150.71 TRINITY_DN1979_c0_g1_i1:1879-4992(+)
MFRPLTWNQNKEHFSEQNKEVDLASGNSHRDSSTFGRDMGKAEVGTVTEPARVQPISISSALDSAKLVRPVPIANKVLISFEDGEDSSSSQDVSLRQLRNCPNSLSEGSVLSLQNEDATLTFSSNRVDEAPVRSNANDSSAYGTIRAEPQRKETSDSKCKQFGSVSDYDETGKPERRGFQDFPSGYVSKVGTPSISDSRDDSRLDKPILESFIDLEYMENVPPASILIIESPASGNLSQTPNSVPINSKQEGVKTFATPLHFESFKCDGSNDSKTSESLSSVASSRGDDPSAFSFSSTKSSDDHRDRSRGSASASSSSSFKSDDVITPVHESLQKHDRNRRSRDQKRVLRIFDRRQNSAESPHIFDNPWFQAMAFENEFEEVTSTLRQAGYTRSLVQKGKRAKMSKLGRSLKKQGKRKKTENVPDKDPISHDKEAMKSSLSANSAPDVIRSSKDIVNEELRHVLRKALLGKRRLDDVLECMMHVYTRPSDSVLQLLYKYFGSVKTVESAVKWITGELRVLQEDEFESKRSKETEAYIVLSRIYREILLHIFTTGPGTMKKAFLNSSKARSALVRFFEAEVPQRSLELKSWARISVSIFRILNSLMTDHASDVVQYISSKDGLLRSIVTKHICFPEVVSFVSKLCASDALAETSESHTRHGHANAEGILLLAKEHIIDTLAHVFIDSCDSRSGNSSALIFDIQRNSLQCLKDISFKAVTMPKFGKTNCTMNVKQIKMLNTALDSISLYSATEHIQAGIEYSLRRIDRDSGRKEELSSLFAKNYPLIRILSLSTDLLDVVLRASESKNIAVRRTIGMVSTKNLEEVLLSKLDDLCVLLRRNSASLSISTTRLSIIQLLRCLFTSDQKNVRVSLSNKKVPELLLDVLEENELCTLMHKAVIACLEASLKTRDSVLLHKQWINCLATNDGWATEMRSIAGEKQRREESGVGRQRSQIQCTYTQIASVLIDIAHSVYMTDLSSLFNAHGVAAPFLEKLEVEIMKSKEAQKKPCGGPKPEGNTVLVLASAEFLAARLDDVNAV